MRTMFLATATVSALSFSVASSALARGALVARPPHPILQGPLRSFCSASPYRPATAATPPARSRPASLASVLDQRRTQPPPA
jgi:hypothetical protein